MQGVLCMDTDISKSRSGQAQVAAKVGWKNGSNMQAHRVCVARDPHSAFQGPVGMCPARDSLFTCKSLSVQKPLSTAEPLSVHEPLSTQLILPTQPAVKSAAAQLLLASNPFLYL